ncbi:MAG: ATPase, partial [Paracoccaceae bacterium]|nr:ATPase [Paracoccaceae bacterium]
LIRRFDRAPKPMYYQPEFLAEIWDRYLTQNRLTPEAVDPDAFLRWGYAQLLAHRQPRYAAMAENWGVTVTAEEVARIKSPDDFTDLVAQALERAR